MEILKESRAEIKRRVRANRRKRQQQNLRSRQEKSPRQEDNRPQKQNRRRRQENNARQEENRPRRQEVRSRQQKNQPRREENNRKDRSDKKKFEGRRPSNKKKDDRAENRPTDYPNTKRHYNKGNRPTFFDKVLNIAEASGLPVPARPPSENKRADIRKVPNLTKTIKRITLQEYNKRQQLLSEGRESEIRDHDIRHVNNLIKVKTIYIFIYIYIFLVCRLSGGPNSRDRTSGRGHLLDRGLLRRRRTPLYQLSLEPTYGN